MTLYAAAAAANASAPVEETHTTSPAHAAPALSFAYGARSRHVSVTPLSAVLKTWTVTSSALVVQQASASASATTNNKASSNPAPSSSSSSSAHGSGGDDEFVYCVVDDSASSTHCAAQVQLPLLKGRTLVAATATQRRVTNLLLLACSEALVVYELKPAGTRGALVPSNGSVIDWGLSGQRVLAFALDSGHSAGGAVAAAAAAPNVPRAADAIGVAVVFEEQSRHSVAASEAATCFAVGRLAFGDHAGVSFDRKHCSEGDYGTSISLAASGGVERVPAACQHHSDTLLLLSWRNESTSTLGLMATCLAASNQTTTLFSTNSFVTGVCLCFCVCVCACVSVCVCVCVCVCRCV